MKTGRVYIVGCGPGDIGLITKKALTCLEKAEVIIYDRLINERILEMASPLVEKVFVGKKPGQHIKEQAEINQLLIEMAKKNKTVVRLKGGDPFVLGRGGEEAKALADNNIPFEIVPGVTSAIAVPAYAGIPVTHRGVASSFAIITGHEDPEKSGSNLKWGKLATGVDTIVFLMGMNNLPQIVAKLIKHGRPANTPVAVIKDGSRPDQITVVGKLSDIVSKVKKNNLYPPAVIIVGKVVALRKKLRWFDNRPLFGKRILVTRAHHQASILSNLLIDKGAYPVELPVIDIKPPGNIIGLERAVRNLAKYNWIIFTSVNGVNSFFEYLNNKKLDARALHSLKIGAIGPATAESLKAHAILPDYIPGVYASSGIVAGLKKYSVAGQRFLIPRADIADEELAQDICSLGAYVNVVISYSTSSAKHSVPRMKKMFSSEKIDVVTFTSSSTVSNLIALFGDEKQLLHNAKIACIGHKTASTAAKSGLNVDIIAKEHTIPGLIAAIEQYFSKET